MSDETWVVTLPKLGESVTEGVIGTFFKNVGDEVEFDDPLFEVSTDKVDTEVPSSYDGVVLEVLAQRATPSRSAPRSCGSVGRARRWRTGSRPPRTGSPRRVAGRSTIPPRRRWAVRRARRPRLSTFRRRRRAKVFEVTMPKLGESVTEGTIGTWFKAVGDVSHSTTALRRVDRQGGLGDPEPVRREDAGHPGRRRSDGAGRYGAGTYRGAGSRGGRIGGQRKR